MEYWYDKRRIKRMYNNAGHCLDPRVERLYECLSVKDVGTLHNWRLRSSDRLTRKAAEHALELRATETKQAQAPRQ